MKKHNRALLLTLLSFIGFILIGFNSNLKVNASYWHAGMPYALDGNTYQTYIGGEYLGEASFDSTGIGVNTSQNAVYGTESYYHKVSKRTYYLSAYNESYGDNGEYVYYKVKLLSNDAIHIYVSIGDINAMNDWGKWYIEN